MKRSWTEEELVERWTLLPDELPLLANKSGVTRLGFAVLLRFFAGEGRFPKSKGEVPGQVVSYLGRQVGVAAEEYLRYDWRGRSIKYHRAQVRGHFGFREATAADGEVIAAWLAEEVLPREQDPDALREAFYRRYRELKVEPPSDGRVERLLASAKRQFEEDFCATVFGALPGETVLRMDALLASDGDGDGPTDESSSPARDRRRSVVGWLKADPGRVGLESMLEEVEKLRRLREIGVPEGLFAGVSSKVLKAYRQRAVTEKPSELAAHPKEVRATLTAALLWSRSREITDSLADLLIQVVHRIGARAERRVERELLEDLTNLAKKGPAYGCSTCGTKTNGRSGGLSPAEVGHREPEDQSPCASRDLGYGPRDEQGQPGQDKEQRLRQVQQ